jgi:hypothetical protein
MLLKDRERSPMIDKTFSVMLIYASSCYSSTTGMKGPENIRIEGLMHLVHSTTVQS